MARYHHHAHPSKSLKMSRRFGRYNKNKNDQNNKIYLEPLTVQSLDPTAQRYALGLLATQLIIDCHDSSKSSKESIRDFLIGCTKIRGN